MLHSTPFSLRQFVFLGFILLLRVAPSWGQAAPAAPHGYDFLTALVVESSAKSLAKILITPALQGKTEIQLADVTPQYPSSEKNIAAITQNSTTVNQLLSEATIAGWELFQVCPLPPHSGTGINPVATRYLFRKPRP